MSVSSVMVITVVFFAVAGAFFGLIRGFGRSFLRIMTVFAAFLGSAYICRAMISDTDRILHSSYLTKLLNRFGITALERLETALPDVYDVIIALPIAMVAPMLFVGFFVLISLVLLLVYGIVSAFVFPKHRGVWSPLSNLLGSLVGLAQGAVIALVFMVPVVGLVDVAGDAVDVITAERGKYESEVVVKVEGYRDELDEIKKSPVFSYAKRFGAEKISDSLMTFSYKDESGKRVEVSIRNEIVSLAKIYAHAMPLLGVDIEEYGEDQAKAMDRLSEDFEEMDLLPYLIANVVSGACTEWKEGDAFFGIEPLIKGDGERGDLLEILYGSFDDMTAETLATDFATVAEIFSVLADRGVFVIIHDNGALRAKLLDSAMLEELFAIMDANPRMHVLHTSLLEYSVKAFCSDHIGVPVEGDEYYEEYQSMLGTVADALNKLDSETELEEQIEAVKSEFGDALLEYGITEEYLSPTVVETVSDMLIDAFGDNLGSIEPADIESFIKGQRFTKPKE